MRGASSSSSSAGGSMSMGMIGLASVAAAGASGAGAGAAAMGAPDPNRLSQYVLDLTDLEKREAALLALSKQREEYADLAPILWHSVGTITALLQEIVSIYPLLQSVHALTPKASNRCCNALALLQCVASHQDTRSLFLGGKPYGNVIILR
jgi:CCR4-NOT transcription complex subunit 9